MVTFSLRDDHLEHYQRCGYALVEGVFTPEECEKALGTAEVLHARGHIENCFTVVPEADAGGDLLKVYPRMMHPHRVDEVFLNFLKHPNVVAILEQLLGQEAVGIQSMFYWKPPGAKGQAFHQDSYYVRGEPDTCVAAWTALEDTDENNGGLIICEGVKEAPLLEMTPTDTSRSFTDTAVIPPPGAVLQTIRMNAGDTLFFGGRVIHGSEPNTSGKRFRRSLICHYVGVDTREMSPFYQPFVSLR